MKSFKVTDSFPDYPGPPAIAARVQKRSAIPDDNEVRTSPIISFLTLLISCQGPSHKKSRNTKTTSSLPVADSDDDDAEGSEDLEEESPPPVPVTKASTRKPTGKAVVKAKARVRFFDLPSY